MPEQPAALRPATRRIHAHLLKLGELLEGVTMPALVEQLGLASRTVRRAIRELEVGGYVTCEWTSSHHKCVLSATLGPAQHRPNIGPTSAQHRPNIGPTSAQHRPNPATDPSRPSFSSKLTKQNSGCCDPSTTPSPSAPPQQQRLGLSGFANDADRRRASKAIRRLNTELRRGVWSKHGTHGFLGVNDPAVEGMINAMANYPWEEIVACVLWSAERVVSRDLHGALFSTTFKGAAFDDRHRCWKEDVDRRARAKVRAERESVEPTPAEALDAGRMATLAGRFVRSGR